MYDIETIKSLNAEHMDAVNYPRLHSASPRLNAEVAAGIVSIEEDVPVSQVREIIDQFTPRDMPELRRAVRTIKSFKGQSGE